MERRHFVSVRGTVQKENREVRQTLQGGKEVPHTGTPANLPQLLPLRHFFSSPGHCHPGMVEAVPMTTGYYGPVSPLRVKWKFNTII